MALNGFKVFDADLHINEPPDLWERYIAPKYRDRAPVGAPTIGDFREQLLLIDGKSVTPSGTIDDVWGFSTDCAHHFGRHELYMDYERRGWGPDTQIGAMDQEGIDVAVLYPSAGLCAPARDYDDDGFAMAIARAYNNWLGEFCSHQPSRLFGAAMVMPQDIDGTIAEILRTKCEFGFNAIYIRPNPVRGRNWQDAEYDRLWKTCEDEGILVGFHGGASATLPQAIGERFDATVEDSWLTSHVACHPAEMMYASLCMIMGGVLERFPRLRVAFLEANCGWVPYYLWRMDQHYGLRRKVSPDSVKKRLPLYPSEYFKRQCYASIEADETVSCPVIHDYADHIVFSTDYPHPECPFPNGVREFLEMPLDDDAKRRILWDNTCRMYNFNE